MPGVLAAHGCSDEVSTTSKSEPLTRPIEWRASFDQCRSGAPETNQLEPLSARIIPCVLSAWRTIRDWRGNPEMSKLAFRRTRRPIGGRVGSVAELA